MLISQMIVFIVEAKQIFQIRPRGHRVIDLHQRFTIGGGGAKISSPSLFFF